MVMCMAQVATTTKEISKLVLTCVRTNANKKAAIWLPFSYSGRYLKPLNSYYAQDTLRTAFLARACLRFAKRSLIRDCLMDNAQL